MPVVLNVPPPPVTVPQVEIIRFLPGEVLCAGNSVAGDWLVASFPASITRYGPMTDGKPALTLRYNFMIDAEGRARTIRRKTGEPFSGYYVNTDDLAPALAASRFPAGAPQTGCSITYTGSAIPIDSAPLQLLYELASRPEMAGNVRSVYDRVRPAGSNCLREPGQYRRLNLPAFETIAQAPGTASWVFLAFDVDREGRPNALRILGTSGNRNLDHAGLRALSENRYAPGPGYRGCTYHFYRTKAAERGVPNLPADAPVDNGEQPGCVVDPKSISTLVNGTAYPAAFSRREIKGIALIGYDTAPWGALGNIRVLASEPAEAFGEAARSAFSNARVVESDTGRRGCVQRVVFELPPAGTAYPVPRAR